MHWLVSYSWCWLILPLLPYKAIFHQVGQQWKNTAHPTKIFMTNPCFILLVVVATKILLSQAKPTDTRGAEERSVEHTLKSFGERNEGLTKGSSIETKLQSLKTGRSSEASLETLTTRSQPKLDDRTLANGKSLAKYLSRKILLNWSVAGRKLSSFVPIQLKTVSDAKNGRPYGLIRDVRSRIFKSKNWKKFGRVALDHLALRLNWTTRKKCDAAIQLSSMCSQI